MKENKNLNENYININNELKNIKRDFTNQINKLNLEKSNLIKENESL